VARITRLTGAATRPTDTPTDLSFCTVPTGNSTATPLVQPHAVAIATMSTSTGSSSKSEGKCSQYVSLPAHILHLVNQAK
jgi:hypothetical protein